MQFLRIVCFAQLFFGLHRSVCAQTLAIHHQGTCTVMASFCRKLHSERNHFPHLFLAQRVSMLGNESTSSPISSCLVSLKFLIQFVFSKWSSLCFLFSPLLFKIEILYYVRKGITPHCRPQVPPDSAPASYMDLMKMCWDERPERRPTFCGVLKILKRINNGKWVF